MPRRTSRPRLLPDDAPIPEGWTRHDGTRCPVPASSCPAVMFRNGSRQQMGWRAATAWKGWTWDGGSMDILAYLDEPDEMVEVPRMWLGHVAGKG